MQNGIAAVAALWIADLLTQRGAIADHRRDAELGILLCVNGGRVDKQDRARVLVDHIADAVIEKFGLADLGCGHHDDVPHLRVCPCVHRLAEVRGALGTPGAWFGSTLGRQAAVLLRPFGHGQVVRWKHSGHCLGNDLVQPDGCEPTRHRCHAPTSRAVPSRAPRISLGRSDTRPAPA